MGTLHKIQNDSPPPPHGPSTVLERFLSDWWGLVKAREDITMEEWLVCTATMIEMLAEVSSSSHEEKKIILKKVSKKIRK